ncbi:AAA family ATPase [Amycolatopsis minnesotensis]
MGHMSGDTTEEMESARRFAADLKKIVSTTAATLDAGSPAAALIDKVTRHLGVPLSSVLLVAQQLEDWEHATLQRGVDVYLAERGDDAEWFGISGASRGHEDLVGMLAGASRHGQFELGAVDFTTAAVGPDEVTEVVQLGLVATTAPDGTPVIVGVRGSMPQYGAPFCRFEVLSAVREAATAVRDRIDELRREHDVLRGQVLAFGVSEHRGNELLTFLPRPELDEDQVVLPEGVLPTIERHVVSIAEHAERLLASGQHLKRGLLLHGPPGTGKTHTVRYLMGRLPETTVVVLTGTVMRFISKAAALARRLQPCMVVLEDVDLVAQDRSATPMGNPLLFSLLDAMDGIGSDADVTFVLTTNRAKDLENALADRPGRVDLALEIPKPDAEGRERLFHLYGRGVNLTADLAPVVAGTDGVTASFIKELLRRATLRGLDVRPDQDPVTVDDEALSTALTEMQDARNALTRSLLGT